MSASLYPLFLNLQGRTCTVIGGDDMAEAKVRELLNAKAVIRIVAPTVTDQISAWSREEKLCWKSRSHRSGDL
jgi:precorrin-2 dehydrogenase/sirohydrochlorin ferrochelatase